MWYTVFVISIHIYIYFFLNLYNHISMCIDISLCWYHSSLVFNHFNPSYLPRVEKQRSRSRNGASGTLRRWRREGTSNIFPHLMFGLVISFLIYLFILGGLPWFILFVWLHPLKPTYSTLQPSAIRNLPKIWGAWWRAKVWYFRLTPWLLRRWD